MSQISINPTPSHSTNENNLSNNNSVGLNKNLFFIKNEPIDSTPTPKSNDITLNSSQGDLNTSSQTFGITTETTNLSLSLDNTANDQDEDDNLMNIDQVAAFNTNEMLKNLVENS